MEHVKGGRVVDGWLLRMLSVKSRTGNMRAAFVPSNLSIVASGCCGRDVMLG